MRKATTLLCYSLSLLIYAIVLLWGLFGDHHSSYYHSSYIVYAIISFYLVLPVTSFISAMVLGIRRTFFKWPYPFLFSLFGLSIPFLVFPFIIPNVWLACVLPAFFGLGAGLAIRKLRLQRGVADDTAEDTLDVTDAARRAADFIRQKANPRLALEKFVNPSPKNTDGRNEYKEPVSTRSVIKRILLVVLLAIPAEALILFIIILPALSGIMVLLARSGIDPAFFGSSGVGVERFWEFFWVFGFWIFASHVLIYSLLVKLRNFGLENEKGFRYDMLGALAVVVAVFAPYMDGPRSSWILGDFEYAFAYSYLIAFILFGFFTLSTVLFDRHTSLSEPKKIFSSFGISCIVGTFISWLIWLILFQIFNA